MKSRHSTTQCIKELTAVVCYWSKWNIWLSSFVIVFEFDSVWWVWWMELKAIKANHQIRCKYLLLLLSTRSDTADCKTTTKKMNLINTNWLFKLEYRANNLHWVNVWFTMGFSFTSTLPSYLTLRHCIPLPKHKLAIDLFHLIFFCEKKKWCKPAKSRCVDAIYFEFGAPFTVCNQL